MFLAISKDRAKTDELTSDRLVCNVPLLSSLSRALHPPPPHSQARNLACWFSVKQEVKSAC